MLQWHRHSSWRAVTNNNLIHCAHCTLNLSTAKALRPHILKNLLFSHMPGIAMITEDGVKKHTHATDLPFTSQWQWAKVAKCHVSRDRESAHEDCEGYSTKTSDWNWNQIFVHLFHASMWQHDFLWCFFMCPHIRRVALPLAAVSGSPHSCLLIAGPTLGPEVAVSSAPAPACFLLLLILLANLPKFPNPHSQWQHC